MLSLFTAIEQYLGARPPHLEESCRPHLRHYHLRAEDAKTLATQFVTSIVSDLTFSPLLQPTILPLMDILYKHWPAAVTNMGVVHPALQYDLILYHGNCPDGLAAAWCFWRHNRQVECVGMKYDQPPPNVTGRRVAVVDFSFPRDVLEQMKLNAVMLRVWDHHVTARDALAGLDYCTFDMNKAGCELAWEAMECETPLPYFIQATADHDVWRKIPDSEAITRVLREQRGNTFENYDRLYHDATLQAPLLQQGRDLLAADANAITRQLKFTKLFMLRGTNYKVRVGVPPPNLRSEFGEAMCLMGGCDFSLSANYVMEQFSWWLSARSVGTTVNVSQIMKQHFGGGGHFNAAGATLSEAKGQIPSHFFVLCE